MFIGVSEVMRNVEEVNDLTPTLQLVFLPVLYALILKGPLYVLSSNKSTDLKKPEGPALPIFAEVALLGLTAMAKNTYPHGRTGALKISRPHQGVVTHEDLKKNLISN